MKPKVHASADMTNVAYIDRLLRGCDDPAGDADCNLPPRYSMLDFGAGVGQYGHSLLAIDPAHQYRGYDGAGNVETVTKNFIRWVDLSSANLSLPKADWVVSLVVSSLVSRATRCSASGECKPEIDNPNPNPSPRPSLRGFLRVQSSIPSGKHPARILIWKNSSEKGRARTRSRRRRKRRQTLPTPWPIGTALAQAPDRSRRRPGSGLHCHTVDFLKKARSW